MIKKKLTIYLPLSIIRPMKQKCLDKDKTISAYIEELIKNNLSIHKGSVKND